RAPGPGAKRSPVVELARLPFVQQTNDSGGEPFSIVCLYARGNQNGISPALRQHLLLPRKTAPRPSQRSRKSARQGCHNFRTEAKLHDNWYRTGSVHRRSERELNIDVNERI